MKKINTILKAHNWEKYLTQMYIQKFNIVNVERAHVNLKNLKKLAKTVKYLLQERKQRRKRGRGEEKGGRTKGNIKHE